MTHQLPHIRCIECNKPIAQKWDRYQELLSSGVNPEQALDQIGLTRYCCRMWMMSPITLSNYSERQIDPRDTGLQQQAATLTVASAPQAILAPLQAMSNPLTIPQAIPQPPTTAYTVVPLGEGTGIGLPPIPEVPLPEIPALTGTVKPEERAVTRVYTAW